MHKSNTAFWVYLAVFVAVYVSIIVLFRFRQKKRTAALTALSLTIGFQFEGDSFLDPSRAPSLQTALFNRGTRRKFRNVMTGTYSSMVTSIFDYWYTISGGKSSQTWIQTVVAFTLNASLPLFELRPEGFFDRVGDVFTHKDIDFPSHPNFSHRYLLRGPQEQQIRELFTPSLLSFLEGLPPEKKWHVEADAHQLLFYRAGHTVPPDQLAALLEETLSIAKTFLNCAGLQSRIGTL